MTESLGTLEELPQDFREQLRSAGVSPLWPMLRNVLPHGAPQPATRSGHWRYQAIRRLLLRAGELTPVEKAERRVLVLNDPGRGNGAMQVTSSIYMGLQLLLPGEVAPAHRHTPSAARIVIEGEGAYTIVNGEKCPMSRGDLILTPGGQWHSHGNDGTEPVVWLDALDLPLFVYLDGSYAEEGEGTAPRSRPDASQVEFRGPGLVPARDPAVPVNPYPLLRYPWTNTRAALMELWKYSARDRAVELAYVNPQTGGWCLPTLGFTASLIAPQARLKPPVRSMSAAFHVVEGEGSSIVNGVEFVWQQGDTFSMPVFAQIELAARAHPAFLIRVDDAPLQTKLGFYEERARA